MLSLPNLIYIIMDEVEDELGRKVKHTVTILDDEVIIHFPIGDTVLSKSFVSGFKHNKDSMKRTILDIVNKVISYA